MFFIIASCLSIGIGAFLFAIRATNLIICDLETINESIQLKMNQKKISKYLYDFIQFHADVKKLSVDS